MPNKPDVGALARESERLRIDFIERDLELCGTFIALGHTEIGLGDIPAVFQILEKVQRATETIETFIGKLSSTDAQAQLTERLVNLVAAAGELEALVKP